MQELERWLPPLLQCCIEAVIDGAIEPGGLAADRQHVQAHDQEARLREPGLVIGGLLLLRDALLAVRREHGPQLCPGGLRPLDQQRQHAHEVRLAAAEAAVDEAAVLLAPVEDLLHVVEDARQLLLDRGCDDVVAHEPLDLVGARVGLAELHDEAHGADVLRAREIEGFGDGGHSPLSSCSGSLVAGPSWLAVTWMRRAISAPWSRASSVTHCGSSSRVDSSRQVTGPSDAESGPNTAHSGVPNGFGSTIELTAARR
ncbi:MAG: hypothetical protein IPG04_41680 [Polyangiaceae bacterium]|nr:hypothetical protein [Polyangiaceae bacterium]